MTRTELLDRIDRGCEKGRTTITDERARADRYHAWPELKLTEISVRKAGAPVSSDMLRQVNEMRGRRFQAGDTVTLRDGRHGRISGAGGGGAYFQIWIDGCGPAYVHPCDIATEEARRG